MDSLPELKPADVDRTLQTLAERIVELRMESAALFFLEAHLPVTTLLHTGTIMMSPLLSPFFGLDRIQTLQTVLSERDNINRLIVFIEEYTLQRVSEAEKNREPQVKVR